jgi:hypothetical protein
VSIGKGWVFAQGRAVRLDRCVAPIHVVEEHAEVEEEEGFAAARLERGALDLLRLREAPAFVEQTPEVDARVES